MARPRKADPDRRKRWDALFVTAAERADIAAAAHAAGLTVSRYLVAAHLGSVPSRHRTETVLALIAAERQLAALADQFLRASAPIDPIWFQAHLVAIERSFRQAALTWTLSLDRAREADET